MVTIVVIPVVTVTVVVMGLVCAGEVIGTFVEVLTVDMRVNVLIIVSDVAVELLIGALTLTMRGVLTNIGADVLMDVNVNVFAGVMTAFRFAMPCPFEDFRC